MMHMVSQHSTAQHGTTKHGIAWHSMTAKLCPSLLNLGSVQGHATHKTCLVVQMRSVSQPWTSKSDGRKSALMVMMTHTMLTYPQLTLMPQTLLSTWIMLLWQSVVTASPIQP